MKQRRQRDDSKMLDLLTRNYPGSVFESSGHVVFRLSPSGPLLCEPIINDDQRTEMAHALTVELYQETVVSSSHYWVPAGAEFSKRAIAKTAADVGRGNDQIKNILREAGYGRGPNY